MATFRKRAGSWRVEVYVNGVRRSATRPTKAEAAAWAVEQEAQLSGAALPNKTLSQTVELYIEKIVPLHKGARWEELRLRKLNREWTLAPLPLASITTAEIAEWRDARLKKVAPATVIRELGLLRSVLEVARKEWKWIRVNPMVDLKRPTRPPARRRRVSDGEVAAMLAALNYERGNRPETVTQRIAVVFLFALETAMRSSEILGLRWLDVGEHSVLLPKTKNGDAREVPLSSTARDLLGLLPAGDDEGLVFNVDDGSRDTLWRGARDSAVTSAIQAGRHGLARSLRGLHFHDSRAEAIFRLSKKLDVLELAAMIGHRDPRSLMLYYASSAEELAAKLG